MTKAVRKRYKRIGYVNVILDDDAKRITWGKWTPQKNLAYAREKFKNDNTLQEGLKITKLTNVNEIIQKGAVANPKATRAAIVASVMIQGEKLSARSDQFDVPIPVSFAKEQAISRLHMRIDQFFTGNYEEDEGERIRIAKKLQITFETVYYVDK